MEAFILGSLGSYITPVTAMAFALVVFFRKSIRKRHIIALLIATCTSFVAFFALLLWGLASDVEQASVTAFQAVLRLLAGTTVGCGAAVGFSLILKQLGFLSLASGAAKR